MITTVSLAGAAMVGLAALPASAQPESYQYTETYRGDDGSYYRNETYRDGGYDRDRGGYRGDAGYRDGYRGDDRYQGGYAREG